MQLLRLQAEPVLQQLVGLANELHVAVLDAVVDHLDVMAGAILTYPIAAGCAVFDLGCDGLKDLFHVRPGGGNAIIGRVYGKGKL